MLMQKNNKLAILLKIKFNFNNKNQKFLQIKDKESTSKNHVLLALQ